MVAPETGRVESARSPAAEVSVIPARARALSSPSSVNRPRATRQLLANPA